MKFKSMILMAFFVLSHTSAGARDFDAASTKNKHSSHGKKESNWIHNEGLKAKALSLKTDSLTSSKPILYSASWCGYCSDARDFLIEHNIEFHYFDVEKDKEAGVRYKKSGGQVVPFLVLGDKTLKGFTETAYHQFFEISVH